MTQLDPIVNNASLYINGLLISNDATTPNTILNVSAGICRDSNNIIDMNLGNFLNLTGYGTANSSTTLDTSVVGLNGIDTGVLQASKVYTVFIIGDSSNKHPTGTILSLSSTPTLPFGYDSYRIIGYWATDASVHFLKGYMYGSSSTRIFKYDAPQATSVTAGSATSYTAITLTTLIPAIDNLPVSVAYAFTPGAASRGLNLTPDGGVGNAVTITGQVTSVINSGNVEVMAKLASGVPKIDYKVSNSGDAAAINIAGYTVSL